MSATNRSKRGGDGVDFFETPAWAVRALVGACPLKGRNWIEPSAGAGAIIRALAESHPAQYWTAVESDPRRHHALDELARDYRRTDSGYVDVRPICFLALRSEPPAWHVCIGNPPYNQAEAFVRHALTLADSVVFLLRLGFLAGQKRAALYREHGTPDVYVLPRRPSFTGRGTDSADYAWMRWKADGSQEGRVVRLEGEG